MSKKQEPKIELPTQEEVATFGGEGRTATGQGPVSAETPQPPAAEATISAEVDGLKDKLARARAELANVQRRSAQERADAVRFAVADFLRELLPVIDDLERTLQAAEGSDARDTIVQGARLIFDNLQGLLRKHNVELIEAKGQPFDPSLHEAMMQQPSAEMPPNSVLEEVQKGYKLHEQVIRPTKVIVSAAPDEADGTDEVPGDERMPKPGEKPR